MLFFLLSVIVPGVSAQDMIKPTMAFTVSGLIEKEILVSVTTLNNLATVKIDDLTITNHQGVTKSTARGLKGILLKDILKDLTYKAESPKIMSEFYFTFIASDGYKVVYSWNELFNSPTGNHIFVVTEKDGQALADVDDRILVITTTDYKTGRRHIKGLEKIMVNRAD
jgi:hypothetical protein